MSIYLDLGLMSDQGLLHLPNAGEDKEKEVGNEPNWFGCEKNN